MRIHKGKIHKDILSTRKAVLHKIENQAEEIRGLKAILSNLINEIKSLRVLGFSSSHNITPTKYFSASPLPKPMLSNISTPPVGMNYGCDHGELMSELKSVLKERELASA
ncbi:MAG: hypothetical protein ACFFA5_02155 [Promethearchaeota archaeon]